MSRVAKRVLITGSSGFIAWHLIRHLADLGYEIVGLDILPPLCQSLGWAPQDPDCFAYRHADIRDRSSLAAVWRTTDWRDTAIVHLAARTGASGWTPADDAMSNVVGTANVCALAVEHGQHLIVASTCAVYRGTGSYALSKRQMEQWLRRFGSKQDLQHTILRLSNVYGFQLRPKALIGTAISRAIAGEAVAVHNDGVALRDFVHVRDVCRAIQLAVESPTYFEGTAEEPRAIDVCSGTHRSVADAIEIVRGEFPDLKTMDVARPGGDPDPPEVTPLPMLTPQDLRTGIVDTVREWRAQC